MDPDTELRPDTAADTAADAAAAAAAASDLDAVARGIRAVHRGHAPNCSSSGSVVGVALVSTVAAAAVVNAWAWRFLRWVQGGPSGGEGPPRIRGEADGSALIAMPGERAALLHVESDLAARARAVGAVEIGAHAPPAVPGALRAPTEVHLAVTERCPARCTGCYLDAGPERPAREPGASDLRAELEGLAAMGVTEVAFGGGEGLLRGDLVELAHVARGLGLVPNLTTSGFGLTAAVARELAGVMGQVNVSLDGLGETYLAARGWDGAARGLEAVATLAGAGVRVGVNTVLTRPLCGPPGALEDLGEAARRAGATEWQWLRYKPVGRGAAAWDSLALDPDLALSLWPRALALEAQTGLVMRFDCALVPFLVAHRPPLALARRLGLRGCPGGHSLWARSAAGAWAPCSFAPGLLLHGPPGAALPAAWLAHPPLQTWRDRALAPPEPCASCEWSEVCRGGCRAVSAHLAGDPLAPDPECPRVRAWRAAGPSPGESRAGAGL